MRIYKIPKNIIFEFSTRLLNEANVDEDVIETDLHMLIYESGGRGWDEDDDFFYIEYDEYDY